MNNSRADFHPLRHQDLLGSKGDFSLHGHSILGLCQHCYTGQSVLNGNGFITRTLAWINGLKQTTHINPWTAVKMTTTSNANMGEIQTSYLEVMGYWIHDLWLNYLLWPSPRVFTSPLSKQSNLHSLPSPLSSRSGLNSLHFLVKMRTLKVSQNL